MKNYLTSMLGALTALVVFAAGCVLLVIGFIAVMAAVGSAQKGAPAFERGSYLVFDLGAAISDAPPPVDMSMFRGGDDTLQLRTVTRALQAAAKDERIAGVFLTGELTSAAFSSGFAALKEVRDALVEFRESGKPIQAYLTYATTKTYYLASTASEVAIDPFGMIVMPGLASEPMFFAGAFEKYGINVQVTRAGKYKSAGEPFTRRDMSPENREELQKLLNDLWAGLLDDIGPSRKLTPERLQAIVDAEGMIRPQVAKTDGLVDRIAYRDEIYEGLKTRTGRAGTREPFKQVALADYARLAKDMPEAGKRDRGGAGASFTRNRIAVVYANGEIVDGEGEDDEIGGTRFSRELRKLRQDPNVKAIVLRVNSPGGSASASEVIGREVRLIAKVKPIVVSMGSYAASGGYWISTHGARIFAEPTTITGSIGVYGLQFDVKRLANDFGVTFDAVKTGKFADTLTISRSKTPEELAVLQRTVDWIYSEFIGKVAEGRKLEPAAVEAVAQGRVWSGSEALKIGLVDELGGLEDAIAFAAEKAGIAGNYRLSEYPRQKELIEAIQELLEKAAPGIAKSKAGLGAKLVEHVEGELKLLRSLNDPHGVYARLPMTLMVR